MPRSRLFLVSSPGCQVICYVPVSPVIMSLISQWVGNVHRRIPASPTPFALPSMGPLRAMSIPLPLCGSTPPPCQPASGTPTLLSLPGPFPLGHLPTKEPLPLPFPSSLPLPVPLFCSLLLFHFFLSSRGSACEMLLFVFLGWDLARTLWVDPQQVAVVPARSAEPPAVRFKAGF